MLLCVSDNIEEELWKRRGTYMTEYCFLVETFCLQKQVAKEVASKPVDILSEAAMRNAYYTCHNVQVKGSIFQIHVTTGALFFGPIPANFANHCFDGT